ncbi:hypothetical protein [Nocardia sp. NPDC003979]
MGSLPSPPWPVVRRCSWVDAEQRPTELHASNRRRPISCPRQTADEFLEDTVTDGKNGSRYRIGRDLRRFSLDVGNRGGETFDELVSQAREIP